MDYTCSSLLSGKCEVHLGDHLCSIYRTIEEKMEAVIPFMTAGLRKKMKCVYVLDEMTKDEVVGCFKKKKIDLKKYLESGQFEFLDSQETYLAGGKFEPEKMIDLIKNKERESLKEGYAGVFGAGEMSWARDEKDKSVLVRYEARLNEVLERGKVTSMCQYDERKFSHEELNNVIRNHPRTFVYGKLYENKYFYTAPEYMKDVVELLPGDSYGTILEMIREG